MWIRQQTTWLQLVPRAHFPKILSVRYLLSFGAAVLFHFTLSGQCTVNSSVFAGPNDYGVLPDTITNLPIAYVGSPYSTDLQVHVAADTVTSLGTFPIVHIAIDSIAGLPQGFSYATNPSTGIFPGGSYGCFGVTGTAVSGQEIGGPLLNGTYPIVVYATAVVNILSVQTDFPIVFNGYRVVVQAASSVTSSDLIRFSVLPPAPNPSDLYTEFRYTVPSNGPVEFALYNMVGAVVVQQNLIAEKGANRFTLETATLPPGIYMFAFRQGGLAITRRITVSH